MKSNLSSKSLKVRAVGMVTVILLLVIGALTIYLTIGFTGGYKRALQEKSSVVGNEFRNDLSKALSLG
ncbi:MAG TPA: hypothetical protein VGB23_00595, partial [Nitrospirota bacterium]